MPIGAAIVGGSLISGALGAKASSNAAKAAAAGDANAIAEQRRQFDIIMGMQQPYQTVGTGALNRLASIYGLPTYQAPAQAAGPIPFEGGNAADYGGGIAGLVRLMRARQAQGTQSGVPLPPGSTPTVQSQSAPDYSSFFASPDYQFRRNEGMRDLGSSFAARGGAFSGNALRALTDYNSNLAAGEYGNYFNRMAALAGVGQAATNQASSAAGQAGANISNLLSQQGQARASGIMGSANSLGNTLNSGLQNWLLYKGGYFG